MLEKSLAKSLLASLCSEGYFVISNNMLFKYKAIDSAGATKKGSIDAASKDLAISALQQRGLIILSIEAEEAAKPFWRVALFEKVKTRDVVILSRQISTLFSAEITALRAFTLLAQSAENPLLAQKLNAIASDLQAGSSISEALSRQPDVFSDFYVNMVKAGEETGKLSQTFLYLADYLERQYELTTKTKNALVYPAFVVATFIVVMVLMFTLVIPKLGQIIIESGQTVPVYTKIVLAVSNFLVNYGVFLLIFLGVLLFYLWRYSKSESGRNYLDSLKIRLPLFGELYRKLYLSRMADNLNTMLSSGISIVRALEVAGDVVGNRVYKNILREAMDSVKAGQSIASAFSKFEEIPPIMTQIMQIGEETGNLGSILKTLADFYKREVEQTVSTLVGLIEPVLIVFLGVAVGILLTSVLVPIYNIAGGIG